ncbi:MAG: histidine--tRNA ligase [Rhodospirillales bacterium]|nr:histidine--tRNA ligase [Rhodospirillales bacterium]
MASLKPVRGTQDVLPDESRRMRRVEQTALDVAERYGYGEISTPIFESTDVFSRTLGDTSDIVTKEMYTFEDKGGERITLRPEGTAGVARAVISGGLQQDLPLKFFYRGPMFRYERPQKGRRRQFSQVGVELIGASKPLADIEIIALGRQFLDELGVGENVTLEINTLGDDESRATYRTRLVDYLQSFDGELSDDSRERLTRNPLRILDSKDEGDRKVIKDAPRLQDFLNDDSRRFFDDVLEGLGNLGIPFELNSRLVRGLDYYCHTAFEFTTQDLGAQGTVLAGGRYDGLFEQMGGQATPGIGWAAGVERLALLMDGEIPPPRPVAVIPIGEEAEAKALEITQSLRRAGIATDLGYSGNMKRRMKRADKIKARWAVILGEDELARGGAALRDMDSGEQIELSFDTLADYLSGKV